MRRIGVFYNPLSEGSQLQSEELATWLHNQGLDIWRGVSQEARDNPAAFMNMDLLVALGGDGTFLRAARPGIMYNIPVLPIAMGHLSFMAEIGPSEMYQSLTLLLEGGGWHDRRALIDVALYRQGHLLEGFTVLNEVVLSRGDISRIITVEVQIDDIPLTTYRADGVLVATATGSTAYALSAGGPIVDPRSRALVLVAIAAHLTAIPSMVLHEDTLVKLRLRSHHHAVMSVDGHDNLSLDQGDEIQIRRSEQTCVFARVQPSSQFYAGLVPRLRRE